jgi:hypothetical protein
MDIIDKESYWESQLDRADFMRKAIAEDKAIQDNIDHWNSLNDVEKLEHIDFMTGDREFNCGCTQDDKGNVRWVNLICYRCAFVNEIRDTKPHLLEKYHWVRPKEHFIET